jgi:hypothetical protein
VRGPSGGSAEAPAPSYHQPPATKSLSADDQGRVMYRYKQPFRNGSTHVPQFLFLFDFWPTLEIRDNLDLGSALDR